MKRIIAALFLTLAAGGVNAQDSAFLQLSLTPGVALQSKDTLINGISLNIWGQNPQQGFAWGFVNGSTGTSSGFTLGLVNYTESYTGVAFGFVNCASKSFGGVQYGFVNTAEKASGLQFGTVNYAGSMNGVQIGIVNIIRDNPWFKEFPDKLAKGFVFVNWSF